MRPSLLLPAVLVAAVAMLTASCAPRKLSKRLPGTWRMEHYNEWTEQSDSHHDLDNLGYIVLRRSGSGELRLTPGKAHGRFDGRQAFRWALRDSLLTLQYPDGRDEQWLITSGYDIYMQWVSVNAARDTVRTMYVAK